MDIDSLVDEVQAMLGARGAPETTGLGTVAAFMGSQRSIRAFTTEPVDQRLIEFIIKMATRAGSGGNIQPWRFVVVQDSATRAALGDWYRQGWQEYERRGMASLPAGASPARRRSVEAAAHLATRFESVPVVVVPCFTSRPEHPVNFYSGASIYPAVQNLLLAARAVGLGATLTHMQALSGIDESARPVRDPDLLSRLREILHLPDTAVPAAVIPVGWPAEPFGPTRRRPLAEVMFEDRWDQPWRDLSAVATTNDGLAT